MKIVTHACVSVDLTNEPLDSRTQAMSMLALEDMTAQLPPPESDLSADLVTKGFIRVTWEMVIPEEGEEDTYCLFNREDLVTQ